MQLKLILINVILAVLLVLMVAKGISAWRQKDLLPGVVQEEKQQKRHEDKIMITKSLPPEKLFESMVEKNLFSPERREFIIPENTGAANPEIIVEKKIQGKTILLYGVVLSDGYAAALISNPEAKAGEKASIWIKEGERFSNLKVTAIQKDSIMLNDGESTYKVLLNEKERKQRSEPIASVDAPTVISMPKPKPTEKAPQVKTEDMVNDSDFDVVSTPFGTVKRRK